MKAYTCEKCGRRWTWQCERVGDARIIWACGKHLPGVLVGLVRPQDNPTQVIVTRRTLLSKTHGTITAYMAGCRCDQCREAQRVKMVHFRESRKGITLPLDSPRHGRVATYNNWGCRCDSCRQAKSKANSTDRSRRAGTR